MSGVAGRVHRSRIHDLTRRAQVSRTRVLGSSVRDTKLLTVVIASTAQVSPFGSAATALSWADPNCGVVTTVQLVPFHCSVKGSATIGLRVLTEYPTAQTSVEEMAETPLRAVLPGAGTMLQAVPFQFSMIEPFSVAPTAQTSLDEMAVTAVSGPPSAGVETTLQAVSALTKGG
jgi:hypothetical protein